VKLSRIHPLFIGLLALTFLLGSALTRLPSAQSVLTFATVTCGWIVSLALHEWAHAFTAFRFGDTSVKENGYLSLNPLQYTHPFLSIILPLIFLIAGGIGLPGGAVYINRAAFRDKRALSLVSLAGPAANALIALLLIIPISWWPVSPLLMPALSLLVFLQISSTLFNLLPIPGLDGFGVLEPFLPARMMKRFQDTAGLLILILMYAFFTDSFISRAFWKGVLAISDTLGIHVNYIWQGLALMRFWENL